MLDVTESNGWSRGRHTTIAQWQLAADCLIAVAYFSIPIELVYFLLRFEVVPFRWVIAMFGAFIVLCGTTHLTTVWVYYANSQAAHVGMTVAKVVTAVVSCLTAIILLWVIPVLLNVKKREEFYYQKTAELDVEVGNMKKDQQVLRHVRMLTDEIRSSLDRHKILATTLEELSRTLELDCCSIWMPKKERNTMELAHRLGMRKLIVSEIDASSDLVRPVISNSSVVLIPPESLGSMLDSVESVDTAIGVRIPLLSAASSSSKEEEGYALMILTYPRCQQKALGSHEIELIRAVADQVAVALSHAAVVEETLMAQERLIEQNLALQKAKKEAEAAVIARNEFLVVMNHEMRTPMHAVIALSSLLLEMPSLTPEQRSMIETISKSGNLLATLINDVLDFSRLEAGSLNLDVHPFLLAKLLDDAERLVTPLAQAKKLPFALKLVGELPEHVLGDSTRLLQVILNVVGNAIKFTAEGHVLMTVFTSRASFSCSQERRYLHVEVEDTGIGIRPADVPRLFNKFVQVDSTISRKFGGSGLGLAICKKFVELMGGSICIESEGIGKGSTCRFHVCLTILRDKEEVDAVSPKQVEVDFKEMKVLAVDDNSVNRTVIRRLLNSVGCKATIVDSGENCLKALAAEGPTAFNIILLDLCMPEMDGFQVATEIERLYSHQKRPLIVALTANTDEKTRSRCFEMGMDGMLNKPISANGIKAELVKLMQRKTF